MIIFILTGIFDYALQALLVGVSFFTLFGNKIKMPYSKKYLYILFCIFAFLDIYVLPAVLSLDATVTIGNKQIVEFFNLKDNLHLSDIISLGWFDVIVWLLQTSIALSIGGKFHKKLYGQKTLANNSATG